MRLKKVAYKISCTSWLGQTEAISVTGYAVESDVPVRFCVRSYSPYGNTWIADHWDTGLKICEGTSRSQTIDYAEKLLRSNIQSGSYERAVLAAMKRLKTSGIFA